MSVSLLTYIFYLNFHPRNTEGGIFSQGIVDRLAISFRLYELDLSISFISVVLIQETGVFTSSNTPVGSDGLFMHISLKLLALFSLNMI